MIVFSQTASKGEQDASSETNGLSLGPLSVMECVINPRMSLGQCSWVPKLPTTDHGEQNSLTQLMIFMTCISLFPSSDFGLHDQPGFIFLIFHTSNQQGQPQRLDKCLQSLGICTVLAGVSRQCWERVLTKYRAFRF